MASLELRLRWNADNTLTIRVGRLVEHVDAGLPRGEVFDRVKWAAISKGVVIADVEIVILLDEARKEREGQ